MFDESFFLSCPTIYFGSRLPQEIEEYENCNVQFSTESSIFDQKSVGLFMTFYDLTL
ncbi:MAG: hypothetical protein KGI80_00490 [Verrucomicrobiota bacterium]|nr:hypothetical protein [Verrucomicrobiota bacterium]